jgi:heptosyltransferase II
MTTLVVRFSSFGDVVLAGAVTGALAPVRFLTLRRYVPVAASLPGVVEAIAWEDRKPLGKIDRVVDLHASMRSRHIVGVETSRVRRYDLRRRLRVALKTAPAPRVIDRYAEAAGVAVAPKPWIAIEGPRDALLLCPGSQHATKRWPAARFAELGREWDGSVVVLGGPGESSLVEEVAAAIPNATCVADAPFPAVLEAVGRARVAVAGDTGLLHLCGAAGVPVVALFGPTTSADGFWCHEGTVLESTLPCRPCSRHGRASCPMRDHLCLRSLDVGAVLSAARALA